MKKVSFLDTKIARWALPAGIVALAAVTLVSGQAANFKPNAAVTELETASHPNQKAEIPAASASPKITVNGTKIPTDKNGTTEIPVRNGEAQVEVSDGRTTITATSEDEDGDTSNQESSKVQIDLNSTTNGGTNSGKTRVFGSSYSSDNGSKSFSKTRVFSTGSDHVSITQK